MYSKSRLFRLSLSLVVASLFPSLTSAAPKFQEGQWEYRVSVEMPGMQMKVPPSTYTQCVKQSDVVPKMPEMDCEKVSHNVSGDTVTWSAKCKQKDMRMEASGRVTYKGSDRMEGTIKNTMTTAGQPNAFSTVTNISGRRIGACKK